MLLSDELLVADRRQHQKNLLPPPPDRNVFFSSLGASDSEGRDYKHALEMAKIMKQEVKAVDVFLLLFNGQNPRFEASILKLLKLYQSIFSDKMWKNVITEVNQVFKFSNVLISSEILFASAFAKILLL